MHTIYIRLIPPDFFPGSCFNLSLSCFSRLFLRSKRVYAFQDYQRPHYLSDMTVMIIDDHQPVRKLLREWLSEEFPHWDFIEASNGREAIEACRMMTPGLAIMDIKHAGHRRNRSNSPFKSRTSIHAGCCSHHSREQHPQRLCNKRRCQCLCAKKKAIRGSGSCPEESLL